MIKGKSVSISKSRARIVLEPALERSTQDLSIDELETAARIYFRWSKQLWVKIRLLRAAEFQQQRFQASPSLRDSPANRRRVVALQSRN